MVILLLIIVFLAICAIYSEVEKGKQEMINNYDQVELRLNEIKELLKG